MLRNAQDFISLVSSSREEEALQLIKSQPLMVLSLFKKANEVIKLAGTICQPNPDDDVCYEGVGCERAYQLTRINPATIAALFQNSNQFIKLAKAGSGPAGVLIEKQSTHVMSLFDTVDKFIQFVTEVDYGVACHLISKEHISIFALFKKKDDFKRLIEANAQVAEILRSYVKFKFPLVGGLLKDLFPPRIEKTSAPKVGDMMKNNSKF